MVNYRELTDDNLWEVLEAARNEYQFRRDLVSAFEMNPLLEEANQGVLGRVMRGEWVQPLGAFDAYPKGWVVSFEGKFWVSLVAANTWKPGVSGWREFTEPGEVPVWVQPLGAHDAYSVGDRVLHGGGVWVSNVDANVWEPGVFGWDKYEEEAVL